MTFSNRAAREMRERIQSLSEGMPLSQLLVTTFHSFCARLLRTEANYIGLSRNFSIYDDSEMISVIKNILNRRGISQKEIHPQEIKYYINLVKNKGYFKGCADYEVFAKIDDEIDKDDLFYEIYEEYERELHTSNAVDFGGLIVGVLELFAKHPKILERYQKRFKYLLVDEYQDTNRAQFLFVLLLSEVHKNICVVGDEDQSIYSWRGADINNILDFENYFPEYQYFKLEQNYRSSKNIIDAASHVINQNRMRKGKVMWTDNQGGEIIEVIECLDDTTEAKFITEKILELVDSGVPYSKIAIFYRNNSQSRVIEDSLRKFRIPYKIVGGIKFYDRKEIKDLLSYMKLITNDKDSLSLSRIINSPARGIGAVSLRKLETEAIKNQLSLYELIKDVVNQKDHYSHLKVSSKVFSALSEFVELIESVKLMEKNEDLPSHCYEKILEDSGYLGNLKSVKSYENMARIENLKELLSGIRQFEMACISNKEKPTLSLFLESITLDNSSASEEEEYTDPVVLMTVHSSKGLEYEYVIVSGLEENLFPSAMSLDEGEDRLEEERRLFTSL